MAKERIVEQLRAHPLHDRHRLLGRLAHPAAGRERLPGHLPGDPAPVLLPGRALDGHPVRRLPRPSHLPPELRGRCRGLYACAVGPDRWATSQASTRSRPTRRSSRRATSPSGDCVPEDVVYDPETNPDGVRCSILDYMINVFGPRPESELVPDGGGCGQGLRRPSARQRGSPVRARRACSPALITTEQFVTLNEDVGGLDIDIKPTEERSPGRPPGGPKRLPERRDQRGEQPRPGRDHRPPWARPRDRPRRLSQLGAACAARPRARHPRQPGDLVRPHAAAR